MIELNDWLSIDKVSGEGNDTITLTADKNESDNEKNASLAVKTRTSEVLVNISQSTLTQAYTYMYKNLISSEWQGGTKILKILTTHEDLTYTAPEWVTVTSERNGYINTYTITFNPNTTNKRRFGTLYFKTWNHTFTPVLLAQGIESEENKVIFYLTLGEPVEPYNSSGIVNIKQNEYVKDKRTVSSLLYNSPIINVPENLFYNKMIECVSLPPSVKTIGANAFYQTFLKDIDWYNGITAINERAFEGAFEAIPPYFVDNFPYLELPSSLQIIGLRAFAGNAMFQRVNLPSTLQTIGANAFKDWRYLNSISCNAIVAPTINEGTFFAVKEGGILEYPQGSDYSEWLSSNQYYLGYYNWTGVPY